MNGTTVEASPFPSKKRSLSNASAEPRNQEKKKIITDWFTSTSPSKKEDSVSTEKKLMWDNNW
jgi:hypothetical protein